MIATYKTRQDCQACYDLGWIFDMDAQVCAECNREHTHTGEVLELGVGLFGDKAVVKDLKTGQLDTVSIKSLRIKEDTDETG